MKTAPYSILIINLIGLAIAIEPSAALEQLFLETQETQLAVSRPRHAINLEYVGVNFQLLERVKSGDELSVEFHGRHWSAIVDQVKPQSSGYSIRGTLKEARGSFFTITVVDGVAAGTFFIPGRKLVRLRFGAGGGLHYLHEVVTGPNDRCAGGADFGRNPGKFPIPNLAKLQQRFPRLNSKNDDSNEGGGIGPPEGNCGPTDPTFDVLLVYSDDARIAAGGTSPIRAECINAVEVMELTYLTCSVLIRTNIVWLSEVSYDESGQSYEDHLNALTNTNDGVIDQVHTYRDIADADFVSLIINDNESGGLGWCLATQNFAMSVCRWDLLSDAFVLPHEIGHNIGCAHNPEAADCKPTTIGFGHNFFVPSEGEWRHTVMAYELNDSTVVPYYSSPSCQYEDVATGTADRDNLAVILARQGTCEGFRLTRMDVWVDFSFGGSEFGSFNNPFDTLIEGVNRTHPTPVADFPVLHIKAGSRNETLTIDKPMFIEACGGTVTIGG